jgi:hypothetical protein
MHATPIQARAAIQMAVRVGTATTSPATNAACGSHHANRFVRVPPTQSADAFVLVLITR